jgi:hypothetical protein
MDRGSFFVLGRGSAAGGRLKTPAACGASLLGLNMRTAGKEPRAFMKVSIPRLASIRLKAGGATPRILRNKEAEEATRAFVKRSADVVAGMEGTMAGYAIVAWGKDGKTWRTLRTFDTRQVGLLMVPEFVKTALQDYISQI